MQSRGASARQRLHVRHATVSAHTTRMPTTSSRPSAALARPPEIDTPSEPGAPPIATMRPTCSWPKTSGAPVASATARTSAPDTVASSTATSRSPSASDTPGTAISARDEPAPVHTMATGAGLIKTSVLFAATMV